MGAYTNLKNAIKQVIKQNGNQEITGQLLQNTLLSMVDTLGTDYKYCGIATPTTVPSTDEGNMYYFAKESGSYTNFTDSAHTNLHIDEQGLYVFTKNAETDWWSSENLVSITQELGDSKDKTISQKAINDAINDAIEGVKKEVIKNYFPGFCYTQNEKFNNKQIPKTYIYSVGMSNILRVPTSNFTVRNVPIKGTYESYIVPAIIYLNKNFSLVSVSEESTDGTISVDVSKLDNSIFYMCVQGHKGYSPIIEYTQLNNLKLDTGISLFSILYTNDAINDANDAIEGVKKEVIKNYFPGFCYTQNEKFNNKQIPKTYIYSVGMSNILRVPTSNFTVRNVPIKGTYESYIVPAIIYLNKNFSLVSVSEESTDGTISVDVSKLDNSIFYMCVQGHKGYSPIIEYTQLNNLKLDTGISLFSILYTNDAINDANDAIEGVKKEVIKNYLYSKKILAVGDSMVQGHSLSDSKNQTWLAKIAIRNNMTRYNKGTNGAKLAKIEYNGTTDNSVFSKICESNTSQYISDDLLSTLDYILIYAGTNDIQNDVQIGDIDSNIATEFCGAINSICKNLQSRAPKAHIGFISPQLRAGIEQKCQTYIDALKKVCAKYSIPVYDQGLNSGICWSNANLKNALTLNDTYHLNENGMEFISYKYEAFLRSI